MTDPAEVWLPIKAAATSYGLDYFQLHKWYRRGHVRGRKVHGRIEIERASLENQLLPPGWVWLAECSQQYEISGTALFDLVQKGQVHARKSGGRWQVERASLEQVLAERAIPAGWLTAKEAGQRLGVTGQEVLRRIRAGQLHARAHGQQLLVAEEEIQGLLIPPGWLTTRQLAEKAGVKSSTVYGWIAKGWLPARKAHGRWIVEDRVPEQRRPPRQPQEKQATRPIPSEHRRPARPITEPPGEETGYLSLREAADRYGLTYNQLYKLIQYGHVRRRNAGRHVLVEVASLEDWLPPPGWAWLFAAVQEYGISAVRGHALIQQGQVRARQRGRRWQVERAGLERALAKR
jgi:excisionase family DNA binding protein